MEEAAEVEEGSEEATEVEEEETAKGTSSDGESSEDSDQYEVPLRRSDRNCQKKKLFTYDTVGGDPVIQ